MRPEGANDNHDSTSLDWEQMRRLRRSVRFPAPLHAADGKIVSPQLLKQVFDIISDHAGAGSWRMTYEDIACEANSVRHHGDRSVPKTRQIRRAVSTLKRIGFITINRSRWGNEYQVTWQRVREFCDLEVAPSGQSRVAPSGHSEWPPSGHFSTSIHKRKPSIQESTSPQPTCGVLKTFSWGRSLTAEELREPEAIETLYRQAVAGGLVSDSQDRRLAFFRWARYCDQTGNNPPALFNSGLRAPDQFRSEWWQRGSGEDEDWARDAIASLSHQQQPDELLTQLANTWGQP